MIDLVVFTDGRDDCLARTIESAREHLLGPIRNRILVDDSGSWDHKCQLAKRYPEFEQTTEERRLGFSGTIGRTWKILASAEQANPGGLVFHLEDDFTFNRAVDLVAMAGVLQDNPHLVQLALRRQPWNAEERAAGGIVEQHPDEFTDRSDAYGHEWLEHRRFFTTNPSLYRRELCVRGWPQVERSEGMFTHELLKDPDARFGFWGSRHSGEWVHHIGDQRVGVGY